MDKAPLVFEDGCADAILREVLHDIVRDEHDCEGVPESDDEVLIGAALRFPSQV